jgi:prephenate dehydrogenase
MNTRDTQPPPEVSEAQPAFTAPARERSSGPTALPPRVSQVAIVGTGLLGGSIGLALKASGFRGKIVGIGRKPEKLRRAVELGCIDEGATSGVPAVRQSQLVILATPVSSFDDWFSLLVAECHPGIVITDVGSTKGVICRAADRKLVLYKNRFVGSHPMAGSERKGPENAKADLFRGRPCIITPQEHTAPDAVDVVEGLWAQLGMRTIRMTPEEHDAAVARISHLPHAVAGVLVMVAERLGGLEVASTGFRDTTRVASGDSQIWLDIFSSNREAVMAAIDAFSEELAGFREALEQGNDVRLLQLLNAAKQSRDAWLRRSEGEAEEPVRE